MRGLDRARIMLGCLQPGQTLSIYSDALNRLADLLHYLNTSGDKVEEVTRFWMDTRANLRREMEQRKQRFDPKTDVPKKIADTLKKLSSSATFFDGVHIFTPHSDVPDDSALRLVFLLPENWYSKEGTQPATPTVLDYLASNGIKPRHRGNRLIFLAPDHGALSRLRDCILVALAWNTIVDDAGAMRLTLDNLQVQQAKRELQTAEEVLPRVARECYKWLLCPMQSSPKDSKAVEIFPLNTSGSALGSEIERVCTDNELVISKWSPIHLRSKLQELYWKGDIHAVEAMDFWEDTLKYLYLPRLKSREILAQAIVKGAASKDFFGTAYGHHDGKFDGFKFGDPNVQLDDTLLLIEPVAAVMYEKSLAEVNQPSSSGTVSPENAQAGKSTTVKASPVAVNSVSEQATQPSKKEKFFHSSVEINPATAKMRLVQLSDEIISVLASDPQASVRITVEINADFPSGVTDQIKRAISENSDSLGFEGNWE